MSPRAVFGLPLYNGERHLAEALDSLLAQTVADLAVVAVDDGSTDGGLQIARRYAEADPRVHLHAGERHGGLVANWRRALDLARSSFPGAEYFAWASDHDVWHPRWLETLVAILDAHPEAVVAWPRLAKIRPDGSRIREVERGFETLADSAETRLRATIAGIPAGHAVYGLLRAEAAERCSPFARVLVPDRLFLAQMAVQGEIRQAPEELWLRRYSGAKAASSSRQRRTLFPSSRSLPSFLPWWLHHSLVFGFGLLARGRPPIGSLGERLRLTLAYLTASSSVDRQARRRRRARRG